MYDLFLEPDKDVKPTKRQLWCPYCGGYTEFKRGVKMKALPFKHWVRACTECGITINDFHVKSVNKLWETCR